MEGDYLSFDLCAIEPHVFACTPGQDVLHRHPLYLIVRMLCYDDGLGAGKNLLALKTTDTEQGECSIWVYQCSSSVSVNIYSIYLLAVLLCTTSLIGDFHFPVHVVCLLS